ncbi:TetR/AcrR family transcriptional regulator [Amycolatopsis alkalitolerans]|uniref:TetR/AcrR family transcriptional regulator n=1 Tax=Amycolatopsis alkalitolerans TaxID=2547244 RepID=UPI00190FA468|nr:TetR/AcrR family transcriptional regulator [Amycolatopsis alkalitolerans]
MKRGRPRSEEARRAILDTALHLCARDGYRQVTIKSIADGAGVGRQTVYRWWPDKAQVLLDALIDLRERELPKRVWETDDPLRDVRQLLEVTFALTHEITGRALVGLLADAQDDPGLSKRLQDTVIGPRRDALREVLQRGVDNGVWQERVALPLVVDFAFGTMWYRMQHHHAPVDAKLAREITDAIGLMLGRRPDDAH